MRVVKKIDSAGRIVIPAEFRVNLGLQIGDQVSLSIEGQSLVVKKDEKFCKVCGLGGNLRPFKDGFICEDCIRGINDISL